MLQKMLNILKRKNRQNRLHRQFRDIQKWQREMYNFKTRQDLRDIH